MGWSLRRSARTGLDDRLGDAQQRHAPHLPGIHELLKVLDPPGHQDRLLAEQFGLEPEEISEDTDLEELGADSVDLVELSMNLEEEFGIEDQRPSAFLLRLSGHRETHDVYIFGNALRNAGGGKAGGLRNGVSDGVAVRGAVGQASFCGQCGGQRGRAGSGGCDRGRWIRRQYLPQNGGGDRPLSLQRDEEDVYEKPTLMLYPFAEALRPKGLQPSSSVFPGTGRRMTSI
mgnify:CR=1 FL=1